MTSSRLTPIVAFGIGIIAFGFFYRFIDDIIAYHFAGYIRNSIYYDAAQLIWDMLPFICIIVGVITLILAGVFYGVTRQVIYE